MRPRCAQRPDCPAGVVSVGLARCKPFRTLLRRGGPPARRVRWVPPSADHLPRRSPARRSPGTRAARSLGVGIGHKTGERANRGCLPNRARVGVLERRARRRARLRRPGSRGLSRCRSVGCNERRPAHRGGCKRMDGPSRAGLHLARLLRPRRGNARSSVQSLCNCPLCGGIWSRRRGSDDRPACDLGRSCAVRDLRRSHPPGQQAVARRGRCRSLGDLASQLHIVRDTFSEPSTQLLLWAGLWLTLIAYERRSTSLALVAGALFGGTVMTRIDALVYVVPLPLVAAVAWLAELPTRRRRQGAVFAAFAAGLGRPQGDGSGPVAATELFLDSCLTSL